MWISAISIPEVRLQQEPAIHLQVVITHASHVCSQHSFGLPLRMYGMHITQHVFEPSITRNLITRVLTICHAKLRQSTALGQKRFELRSLSPVLSNLCLLLVLTSDRLFKFDILSFMNPTTPRNLLACHWKQIIFRPTSSSIASW